MDLDDFFLRVGRVEIQTSNPGYVLMINGFRHSMSNIEFGDLLRLCLFIAGEMAR